MIIDFSILTARIDIQGANHYDDTDKECEEEAGIFFLAHINNLVLFEGPVTSRN